MKKDLKLKGCIVIGIGNIGHVGIGRECLDASVIPPLVLAGAFSEQTRGAARFEELFHAIQKLTLAPIEVLNQVFDNVNQIFYMQDLVFRLQRGDSHESIAAFCRNSMDRQWLEKSFYAENAPKPMIIEALPSDPIQPAIIKKDNSKFYDNIPGYSRRGRARNQNFSQHFKHG